ncbi:hypothetical protein EZJ43_11660 [Pedobacter changchengzhani]|uniref:WbqC family protein n=1 Tax=Pedobacter changchengzhani TaxID=2529274 RepID=A0A4R5MJG5_9SPHI|nr:WbqC family protein [Pedobacter changchengzhani]TDG35672.1 hypothetical protein EZJ43_11660 [Pedobacter changchengzhani]
MQNTAILPLFYLAPINYFSLLNKVSDDFLIEKYEHFPKQTYRNRMSILSPNGRLDLTVPILKGSKMRTKALDVRISNDFKWQRMHWMSLESCYRSSAYFEFYEDDLVPFYTKKFDFLFDYNLQMTEWLVKKLKFKMDLNFTTSYSDEVLPDLDFRNKMSPKTMDEQPNNKPYYQVFEDRFDFMPNLSIVDLLFNQGPHAKNYL